MDMAAPQTVVIVVVGPVRVFRRLGRAGLEHGCWRLIDSCVADMADVDVTTGRNGRAVLARCEWRWRWILRHLRARFSRGGPASARAHQD